MSSTIVVIPSRMESQRFPGKPMVLINGQPLLWHAYQRARRTLTDRVIVTSPDQEIASFCVKHGIEYIQTPESCLNGTQRAATVLRQFSYSVLSKLETVVNWQVDEPLVSPAAVNQMIARHRENEVSTLVSLLGSVNGPNTVRARVSRRDLCLDFSRQPLPLAKLHLGIYCYSPALLLSENVSGDPSPLARAESLEQLTWLENNIAIRSFLAPFALSLNSPQDLPQIVKCLASES